MKKFRITYKKLNSNGLHEIIFTTVVLCKSILGAKRKAKNLQPFTWDSQTIIDLSSEFNLKLDKIEFNY
jgi:hypothetical protein